jgi:hypothetical protein
MWHEWKTRGGADKILMGKFEGWRPLGRPGLRLEDNIKMIVKKWGEEASSWLRIGTGDRHL